MNGKAEYRIIYFADKRYNSKERYIIVMGTWKDAQNMIDNLNSQSESFENVSRYHVIDEWVVQNIKGQLYLKPQYRESIAKRNYWE